MQKESPEIKKIFLSDYWVLKRYMSIFLRNIILQEIDWEEKNGNQK